MHKKKQTASPISFGPKVGFIRYDEAEEIPATVVEFAGWGGTTVFSWFIYVLCVLPQINYNKYISNLQQGGLPSTKLRKISVTVPAACSTAYTADEFNANYMLCAGSGKFIFIKGKIFDLSLSVVFSSFSYCYYSHWCRFSLSVWRRFAISSDNGYIHVCHWYYVKE